MYRVMDIEAIKEEFCDDYCKWAERCRSAHAEPEEAQIALDAHCDRCPMRKL